MGYVPKCLVTYLKMVGLEGKDIKQLIRRMQMKSISGSVKICKTFLNFNEFQKVNPLVYLEHCEISLVQPLVTIFNCHFRKNLYFGCLKEF